MFLGSCIWFLTFGMLVCLATAIKNKGIPFTTGWCARVLPGEWEVGGCESSA